MSKDNTSQIIVTMTSWKKRISTLAPLIQKFYSTQTIKPDKFYLWLSIEEFPNKEQDIPQALVDLNSTKIIDIRWLEGNEKTFKRWHVYPQHWNDYVFVIDDDCIYSPTLIADALEVFKKSPRSVCNIWQQFSAIPTYKNDIKIEFKYDFSRADAMWVCGNSIIPPKTFPLDALSEEQTKFKDENFPTNDEVILISYFLRDNVPVTILPKGFPFVAVKNEAETSLRSNTAENIDEFGYSALDVQLYKQLKFMNLVEKYKSLHPGYNPENYQKISNEQKKHVWLKIIVTAYNIQQHISRCLNSILSQKFDDFSLVVVNDCSIDGTFEKICSCINGSSKAMVISNRKNIRQGKSRNLGLKAGPTADYIWFIDGDDYLPNDNILQTIYSKISESPGFDAYTMKYYLDDSSGIHMPSQIPFNLAYSSKQLFLNGTVAAWSRIHKTESIDREFLDILYEDCLWCAEWLEKERKIKDLDIVSYVYYKNQNGDCQRFLQHDPIMLKRYQQFLSKLLEIFNSSKNVELKYNLYLRLKHENLIQENSK